MRASVYTCYGCKGGDGEPMRIRVFGDLEVCPKCKRKFHDRAGTGYACSTCSSMNAPKDGMCSSCKEERQR